MRTADLLVILAVWGTIFALCGPATYKHMREKPVEPPTPPDVSLVVDTNSCLLPCGFIPTGR